MELMGNYNKQFLYWIHAWDLFKESFKLVETKRLNSSFRVEHGHGKNIRICLGLYVHIIYWIVIVDHRI